MPRAKAVAAAALGFAPSAVASGAGTSVANDDETGGKGAVPDESENQARLVDGVLIGQPEDGSCLFHSIACGLRDESCGGTLRKEIVAFIGESPSLKIANTTIKEWVHMTASKTLQEYTEELACTDTWGGALELAVAALIKSVNIHVYERCNGKYRCIAAFDAPTATRTVNVVYRSEPCKHYDALFVGGHVDAAPGEAGR